MFVAQSLKSGIAVSVLWYLEPCAGQKPYMNKKKRRTGAGRFILFAFISNKCPVNAPGGEMLGFTRTNA